MPRGKQLDLKERSDIINYRCMGMTTRQIACRLKRSKTVVINFLNNIENYGKKKRTGRTPTLSERDIRNIKRLAANSSISPSEIIRLLDLNITVRRIQQILHSDPHLKYCKTASKPSLNKNHKRCRLDFAEKYQYWEEEWASVIFSDEKNLI